MDEARVFTAADLRIGLQAEFERQITAEDIASFAQLSRDHNPLHMEEAYARQTNYKGRIVHGAFQVGLASAMAGMYLPGREVVVGSFQCRFPAPLYYPTDVRVQGEITAWVPHSTSGTLRVRVVDRSTNELTAEIHVSFSLHETRSRPANRVKAAASPGVENKPAVLIIGASGGLGHHLMQALSETYDVIGMARSAAPPGQIEWIQADLNSSDWEHQVEHQLNGRRLHGLVHAAWPAASQGSLLEAEVDSVRAQLEFGGLLTIRIAKFLRSQTGSDGRLVIMGTTAATLKPLLNLSAYSLGKAALEHAVRLLAPELARANITVNLVSPSFVPEGMNDAKTRKVILTETAKVPLGRLCSPEDVAQSVAFFLSPGAAFITGQILPLTGGLL